MQRMRPLEKATVKRAFAFEKPLPLPGRSGNRTRDLRVLFVERTCDAGVPTGRLRLPAAKCFTFAGFTPEFW